jgi:hypothetical protein
VEGTIMKSKGIGKERNFIRFIARATAIMWGSLLIFSLLSLSILEISSGMFLQFKTNVLMFLAINLILIAPILISFRWEAVGGILLIIEGLFFLVSDLYFIFTYIIPPDMHRIIFWFGFPFIIGILLLISWKKSKKSLLPANLV